jgi:hypothetical protein
MPVGTTRTTTERTTPPHENLQGRARWLRPH